MIVSLAPALPVRAAGTPYKGIDVSKWQGTMNWKTAESAGIDFAILRCYAKGKDTKFDEYYTGVRKTSIYVGAYVYMYAATLDDAKKEAAGAVSALNGRKLDFPLFLDVEDKSLTSVDKETLTTLIITELEIFKKAGYKVGIYTSQSYTSSYMNASRLSSYDFWLAKWPLSVSDGDTKSYKFSDQNPYQTNPAAHMWQFSNGGDGKTYGASSKYVDLDYCYYDYIGGSRSLYPYKSRNPDDYPVPERNLSYTKGNTVMVGLDVAWFQVIMTRLGYTLDVDGSFGPASQRATKTFQKDNGIGTDGICGPKTRAKLLEKWGVLRAQLGCEHDYTVQTVLPTCTQGGYKLNTCRRCGAVTKTNAVQPLGHLFDNGTVTVQPTSHKEGVMTYACQRSGCGFTKTESIPKIKVQGDTNLDEVLNAKDVEYLKVCLVGTIGLSAEQFAAIDVDGDGSLTSRDLALLKELLAT